jgi:segregation and condensation protein B
MADSKVNEKERKAQLKRLREELEAQIEEQLAQEDPSLRVLGNDGVDAKGEAELSPKRILEAVLFASAKPLTLNEIRKIIPGTGAKELGSLATELREEYEREGRSFELIEIAGGYQIVTRREFASWLARLELQKRARQATHSALETLAILAYKQPVSRAEIEELRGVDVSGVLSTLLERGFIKIVGKKEVAGRPFLYGTTDKFLEHFGLKSLTDLPSIGEIRTLVEQAVRKEELIGDSRGEPTCSPETTCPPGPSSPAEADVNSNADSEHPQEGAPTL